MSEEASNSVHWSFWVIGSVCLVWNGMGVMAYLGDPTSGATEAVPVWATGAFAIAVWAGALGCLLLLMRKAIAFYVLAASLLGVVVQMFHIYVISKSMTVYGPFEISMAIMIPAIAVFLVWYSKMAEGKGWIS